MAHSGFMGAQTRPCHCTNPKTWLSVEPSCDLVIEFHVVLSNNDKKKSIYLQTFDILHYTPLHFTSYQEISL